MGAQDTMTTQVSMMDPDAHKTADSSKKMKKWNKKQVPDADGTQPLTDVLKVLITRWDGANLAELKEPEPNQTEEEDAENPLLPLDSLVPQKPTDPLKEQERQSENPQERPENPLKRQPENPLKRPENPLKRNPKEDKA